MPYTVSIDRAPLPFLANPPPSRPESCSSATSRSRERLRAFSSRIRRNRVAWARNLAAGPLTDELPVAVKVSLEASEDGGRENVVSPELRVGVLGEAEAEGSFSGGSRRCVAWMSASVHDQMITHRELRKCGWATDSDFAFKCPHHLVHFSHLFLPRPVLQIDILQLLHIPLPNFPARRDDPIFEPTLEMRRVLDEAEVEPVQGGGAGLGQRRG